MSSFLMRLGLLAEAAPSGTPIGLYEYHIDILGNNGGSNVSGDELELFVTDGGANKGGDVIVSLASSFSSGQEVAKLFDGISDATHGWTNSSGNTAWVRFSLDAISLVRLFDWEARINGETDAPRDMVIYGRDIPGEWEYIATFSNETGWSSSETRRLNADTGAFVPTKYRMDVPQINGSSAYITCAGIEIFETLAGSNFSTEVIAATAESSFGDQDPLTLFADPPVSWTNNGPLTTWIEFELGTAKWVRQISWKSPSAQYVDRNVREFILSYWDGAAWVAYKNIDDSINWAGDEVRKWDLGPEFGIELYLENPGAENYMAGWTASGGFTYGFGPSYRGNRNFYAGPGTAFGRAYQDVSVPTYSFEQVDAGNAEVELKFFAFSFDGNDDGWIEFEFYDEGMTEVGTIAVGPEAAPYPVWIKRTWSAAIPATTRTIRVSMNGRRDSGSNNNAYFDNLTLWINVPIP